jgi:hypothetical protein
MVDFQLEGDGSGQIGIEAGDGGLEIEFRDRFGNEGDVFLGDLRKIEELAEVLHEYVRERS